MATLSKSRKELVKKRKIRFSFSLVIGGIFILPYIALYIQELLEKEFVYQEVKISYLHSYSGLVSNKVQTQILLILFGGLGLLIFCFLTNNMNKINRSEVVKITDKIEVPKAVGEGQHGTSRFMTEDEKRKEFYALNHKPGKKLSLNNNAGLVLGMTNEKINEVISCIVEDTHAILIGSTRSGKTRRQILQSIWLKAATGNSMIINDPKGELYLYSYKYLLSEGYEVNTFDLRQPLKSQYYNYMEFIIKAVENNDIPKAIDYTWDLVSVLVGIPKGEPLWSNGESAVIAASILVIALESPTEYKNLPNVYSFIANMCKSDEYGEMPITKYFNNLPDIHPAKVVFAVAEISPDKMRGSFFGSALATLRLFTNWNIADMTSRSDYDLRDIGKRKTALFIIIPDEKPTLYSLASLFINQSYVALSEVANEHGGRLPVPVDYFWDEFGQCPPIPSLGSMLSVGAGKGIRFTLVIQDFQQIEKHYKNDYENIKGNCQIWVYLKTPTQKTLDEISKKTGTYTVQANSANSSISGNRQSNSSYSDSANMQSRPLLFPDEVGRIEKPYSLVLYAGKFPSIFYSPDLSKYYANEAFGLGDEEANIKIRMERENERVERRCATLKLWGIWNQYKSVEDENTESVVSFLD